MSKYEIFSVLDEKGNVRAKEHEPKLGDAELRKMYETMVRTRALNERGMLLQRQGRINFYIGSEGQEAIPTATAAALDPKDWYFPHYRDAAYALYRGATVESMVHQLYGSAKDLIKGRQMPNHFSYKDLGYFSVSSPLTTQVPQAVGAAYAAMIRGEDVVTATGFGDGSTSEGDFHVAMNFAGVWKTPTVFICNNNQWAISVPRELQTASETFAEKAEAYGFEGRRVDGNDFLACYAALKEAADKARRGEGPSLVEAVTFRMGPHSSSDDPKRYVAPALYEEWKQKDPILRARAYLTDRGVWSDEEEAALMERTKKEIAAAVEAAESAGEPAIETVFTDVYEEMPWHLQRQLQEIKEIEGGE